MTDPIRAALSADGPAVPESREPAAVVGQPSDAELLELTEDWPATTGPRHDLSGCPEVPLYSVFADEVVEFARTVLARWGRPAQEPAGEVGELVAWIRGMYWAHPDKERATRAADLLEQRHPAPVPVSERLRYLQAGIEYGYQAGHEDTVEACFGDSSSFAEEMAPEILAEIESDALPLPAGEGL